MCVLEASNDVRDTKLDLPTGLKDSIREEYQKGRECVTPVSCDVGLVTSLSVPLSRRTE